MKKLIFLLALCLVLGMASSASAALVTASVTGDNWIWIWGGGTSWPTTGTNFWKWQNADTITWDLPLGQKLDLYFAVFNEKPPQAYANPGGFLGSFSTTATFLETGTNKLLSDNTILWEVAAVPDNVWILTHTRPPEGQSSDPDDPAFNPTTAGLTWVTPNSYFANNASQQGTYGWEWGFVNGIDSTAEWLWTANNWDKTKTNAQNEAGMNHLVVFHTHVTPVPEPTSMMLLGMGILGLFGLRRKT